MATTPTHTDNSRSPSPSAAQPQTQEDEPQPQPQAHPRDEIQPHPQEELQPHPQSTTSPPTFPADSPDLPDSPSSSTEPTIQILLHHGPKTHTLSLPPSSTLSDLSLHISASFSIPESNQKFLISPKPGLLKPPFTSGKNAEVGLAQYALPEAEEGRGKEGTGDGNGGAEELKGIRKSRTKTKITLLGSTPSQIAAVNASVSSSSSSRARHPGQNSSSTTTSPNNPKIKPAKPTRTTPSHPTADPSINPYTFHTIAPLPYLPQPEKSRQYLHRLASDPGILTTMSTHKFSVALLTEMDPAAHTTASHEGVGRTLGLNRNAGEVIELRLRTDAGDGYRDYKTIRRTLCHELTHNVFGEHDGRFWRLCGEVEREVEAGGWWGPGKGRVLDEDSVVQDRWTPPSGGGEGDEVHDHGAWTGGEYVLGRGGRGRGGGSGSGDGNGATGTEEEGVLSRREILARAADERLRRAATKTSRPTESEHDEDRDRD